MKCWLVLTMFLCGLCYELGREAKVEYEPIKIDSAVLAKYAGGTLRQEKSKMFGFYWSMPPGCEYQHTAGTFDIKTRTVHWENFDSLILTGPEGEAGLQWRIEKRTQSKTEKL